MTRLNAIGVTLLCGICCAHAAPLFADQTAPSPASGGVTKEDDDRIGYIRRAMHPQHPSNVEGLRLSGTGTGFFVAATVVLTNFHVAGNCKALTVGNNTEGQELPAIYSAGDSSADLAILSTNDPSSRPAPFQTALDQETGSGLAIVGYPEHGLPVLQAELDEVLASPDDLLSAKSYFPFGGSVRRGNSGSPVLNKSGAVLGIVRAKINTVGVYRATGEVVDDIGFAVANSTILSFLHANSTPIQVASDTAPLSPDQLLLRAHEFVRQIGCWN